MVCELHPSEAATKKVTLHFVFPSALRILMLINTH